MLRYKNIYMEKANLTLYTVIGKPERIPEAIQKFFAAVAKEAVVAEGQTVLTLQDDTEITFNISHRRDRQEFIASHTEGMANYFLQAETGNEELKTNVIRQIQCFNCVTGIVLKSTKTKNVPIISSTPFSTSPQRSTVFCFIRT